MSTSVEKPNYMPSKVSIYDLAKLCVQYCSWKHVGQDVQSKDILVKSRTILPQKARRRHNTITITKPGLRTSRWTYYSNISYANVWTQQRGLSIDGSLRPHRHHLRQTSHIGSNTSETKLFSLCRRSAAWIRYFTLRLLLLLDIQQPSFEHIRLSSFQDLRPVDLPRWPTT